MKFEKYRIIAKIHTVGYVIPDFDGTIQEQRGYEKAWGKTFTRRHPKTHSRETHTRFNPNGIAWRECNNLVDYISLLERASMACGVPEKKKPTRTDFCIDFTCDDGDYTRAIKYNHLLADCFIACKNVQPKYEGTKHSRRTGEHLNTIVTVGAMELAFYNKAIQKPEERVGNRLELRHKDKRHKDTGKALDAMEKTVHSWRAYLPKALEMSNDLLAEKWRETRPRVKDRQSVMEFVRANTERIYTRGQLVKLFEMLGQSEKQAETSTRNFLHRNHVELVTEQEMMEFFNLVEGEIARYRKGAILSPVRVWGREIWENIRVS